MSFAPCTFWAAHGWQSANYPETGLWEVKDGVLGGLSATRKLSISNTSLHHESIPNCFRALVSEATRMKACRPDSARVGN